MADNREVPAAGLRERKKLRTRATLIDAAIALCERQGFDGTTVDQIAAVAGVSSRTFSRYFATKDAIGIALIDEVLDRAAAHLACQPDDLHHYEALRRGFAGMAAESRQADEGGLTEDRLLRILRVVMSSAALRRAAFEYRANPVDVVVAQRMGTGVHDRRVKLAAAVWGAILLTALQEATRDMTMAADVSADHVFGVLEATYAEFVDQIAPLRESV